MKNIYFICNNNGNHKNILEEGSGASELLFYFTAYKLSNYFNVTIFNRDIEQLKIDNIQYLFLPNNKNPNIENINNSIIIVQRHFSTLIDLHKINNTNRYILWCHDHLGKTFSNLSDKYLPCDVNDYFNKNNIDIIAVSDFHKENIKDIMPNINIIRIYNALFIDIYQKNNNNEIQYNKNQIVFASNWGKGINKILKIGKEYYNKNKDFKLILLKPSYCDMEINCDNYPFIECIGNIKNKKEYCKILQNSLCVLTTSFTETFGCVFAEALHLGVPVIGDNSVKAGFHEIIPYEHMCNYNNYEEVIKKIEEFRKNRPNVKLDKKFYDEIIIEEWIKIL